MDHHHDVFDRNAAVPDDGINDVFPDDEYYYHQSIPPPQHGSSHPYRNQPETPESSSFFSNVGQQPRKSPPHRRHHDYWTMNNSNNFSIAIAIFAIFVFQYRGMIIASLKQSTHSLYNRGLLLVLLDMYDSIRWYVILTIETIFSLRYLFFPSMWGWSTFTARTGTATAGGMSCDDGNAVRRTNMLGTMSMVGRRRGGGSSNGRKLPQSRGVDSSTDVNLSMLPELEDVPIPEDEEDEERERKKARPWYCNNIKYDEIEPAFLNDEDYPPGWLVYHPRYGVISKEESDRYRREEEVIMKQKQAAVVIDAAAALPSCRTTSSVGGYDLLAAPPEVPGS